MDETGTSQNAAPIGSAGGSSAPVSPSQFEAANRDLIEEIKLFLQDCRKRYSFNNAWDVFLTVLGISLSVAVVAAGFSKRPFVSAILGAIIAAVVTAQKAFPFGQRAGFYRLLIGQSQNLNTRASQGLLGKQDIINTLSSLRMDFAQQLPRGSSANQPSATPPGNPGAEPGSQTTPPLTPQERIAPSAAEAAADGAVRVDPKEGKSPPSVNTPIN